MFLELVENLHGKIAVPQFENSHSKMIWIMGRNKGINVVRNHVRHNISKPLPEMKTAPKGVTQEYGKEGAEIWLSGYNAALDFVKMKINVIMFNASGGQIIATR